MTDMKINLSDEPQQELLKALNKLNKRLDNIEKSVKPANLEQKNVTESPTINENKPSNDIALPQIPQIQQIPQSKINNIQSSERKGILSLVIAFVVFVIITMGLYYFFQVNFKMTAFKDIILFAVISGAVGLFGAYLVFYLFRINQKLKFYQLNYQQNEVPLMREEINYPSRCPLCNSKLLKGKVQKENNKYAQILKCKNKNCTYHQEYNLTL